jgi:hypothetical protein
MMKIIIPTRGRVDNQLTFRNLPKELQERTILVCPKSEKFWLEKYKCTTLVQPEEITTIAEKRKWIFDTAVADGIDKIVMLDDDLRFAVRREDDPGLFRKAEPEDIIEAFTQLETLLCEEIPHAGFAVRGSGIGDAAKKGGWQLTGKRMMYSLGYYVPTVKDHAIFGRIGTHEDMDITLQLLRKGFINAVNFSFVTDQAFGKPGGCDKERTIEKNNADALKLAELHPGYVRVVQKDYKASVPRIEVVCSWQKALQDGLASLDRV